MQTVKDLMVPIERYVTVQDDITVAEAICKLQQMRDRYQSEGTQYRPRQLIVLDEENRVVGRLDQMDVVMSLEPKYRAEHGDQAIAHISTSGLSPELLKDMIRWYSLWGETFEERCTKVLQKKVGDCMRPPRRDEYVGENEGLETAIHQMVLGRHSALLATRNGQVIGVLRLSDIFDHIARISQDLAKGCSG